jgi:hypothetical protein
MQFQAESDVKKILGRVVWHVPRPRDQCQVGVKFVNLQPEAERWLESVVRS